MGVGKYSPTVTNSYRQDQDWFEKNGGGYENGKEPKSQNDDEGYDSYGYSGEGIGPDRAGVTEQQYADGFTDYGDGDRMFYLYDRVGREWSRLLCGVEHTTAYPAITGVIAKSAPELHIICSFTDRDISEQLILGYVGSQAAAEDIVKQLREKAGAHGPTFYSEKVKQITASIDDLFKLASENG